MLSYARNPLPAPPEAQQRCPCCGGQAPASRVLVDVAGNQLAYQGHTVRLEAHVAHLALALAERFGKVATQDRIIAHMWPRVDSQPLTTQKVIHVTVSKLRVALRPLSLRIETVYKSGYRMVREAPTPHRRAP